MQVLKARRWTRTVLIVGPKPEDRAFAVNGGVKTGHGAEQKSATAAPA
jgi:hypothetical protein